MNSNRVSDFSIDHILGCEVGRSSQPAPGSLQNVGYLPDGYLQGIPNWFRGNWDYGNVRPGPWPLAPVEVTPTAVPGCVPCEMDFGNSRFLRYGAYGFQPADLSLYPNSALHRGLNTAPQPLLGYLGYQRAGTGARAQPRQRGRMRTVFTDSQTKQLQTLFDQTDYPGVERRAELARSTGLTEETVRVWFKNRRARRKRQRSGGSKVKSPSPLPMSSKKTAVRDRCTLLTDTLFSAFL